jgi:hypothetical protein
MVLTTTGKDLLYSAAPAWRVTQALAKSVLVEACVIAVIDIANDLSSRPPEHLSK